MEINENKTKEKNKREAVMQKKGIVSTRECSEKTSQNAFSTLSHPSWSDD